MKRYCLIISTIISATLGAPNTSRILGGDPADPGQFPSIVLINTRPYLCHGSIINKNWVVTTAGCMNYIKSTTTILAGTNLVDYGGFIYNIVTWFKHEDFDPGTLKNDIGLIQIDGELDFDDVTQPTEFIDPEVDSSCSFAGWGVTTDSDNPKILQFIQQTVLSFQDCSDVLRENLGEEQTCAFSEKGKGFCFGDNGGPLVCDGKLAGIASFFISDCAAGNPDFYTKPIVYTDWINENTQLK